MTILLVSIVSFIVGAINAVAGGVTFPTFRVLPVIARLMEKVANMTSTIGLWPGSAASVVAAKSEFRRLPRDMVLAFGTISLAGGAIGAWLLLHTTTQQFR